MSGNCRTAGAAVGPAAGVHSFPHFQTMDWNIGIDVKSQLYSAASQLEHGHLEHPFAAS
jgi:hypothetical protein